jgi:3D (Asp-Asp-Asp) domain-containing protein
MKNLVRGSIILSILSLFVVYAYAQVQTENASDIANDSQTQLNINNNFSADIELTKTETVSEVVSQDQEKKKPEDKKKEAVKEEPQVFDLQETNSNKAVKKTGSSRAIGVNRGSFSATAYCLKGRTASGTGVRRGIIAADPRVLPLGTRVNITGNQAGSYVVADTGGKIKGKRIDIWMASCADARRFGRRNVNISVLN